MPSSPDTRIAVLETKQDAADEWRKRTDETLFKIADALQRLTMTDMRVESLTEAVQRNGLRLEAIEREMPTLKQTRDGVFALIQRALIALAGPILTLAVMYAYTGKLPVPVH